MKKIIIGGIVLALIIIGFVTHNTTQKGDEYAVTPELTASVRFSWFPSASFTGDIVGIKKFAQTYNLKLDAAFGGPGINPIQMILSGEDTFGWAGADEILAANEKGADLVIIGVLNYHPPVGFASLEPNTIKSPKDFEGTRVGILPYGNSTLLYEIMLQKNGVDRRAVTEITISNDLKSFIEHAYDVHPVFVYDETVQLDNANIAYTMIRPEDFGVTSIKGYVYFTQRETYEKNPDLVRAFVMTMADGWNYAIKNPNESVALLKEFTPEINIAREHEVFRRAIPYFTGYNNQPLNSDTESWNDMSTLLKEVKIIENDVVVNDVLKLEYIHEYYQ